ATGAERLHGAVAAEDELVAREGSGDRRHRTPSWPTRRKVLSDPVRAIQSPGEAHERARQRDRFRLFRGAGARGGGTSQPVATPTVAARADSAADQLHAPPAP